jgi:hypothetical protein
VKNPVIILHFAPLELYPPVQNLLVTLEANSNVNAYLISTTLPDNRLPNFKINNSKSKILRIGTSGAQLHVIRRYYNYFLFFGFSIFFLVVKRPSKVLYFETISSLPCLIYKKFFRRNSKIYIHYHEYISPDEYATGMKLNKYFHRLESRFYNIASWVSHTNQFRMDRFKNDLLPTSISNPFILPNYPPMHWRREPKKNFTRPIRILYVGALSLTTMYTLEFANWVIKQNGQVNWDVYAYNCSEEARSFLSSLKSEWITLHSGVSYNELPTILDEFDIGVVLYKGIIPNYVINAPNKVFEYLASGLSVWFPSEMIGTYEYETQGTYPMVVKLDFMNLDNYTLDSLTYTKNLQLKEFEFYCENALRPLIAALK